MRLLIALVFTCLTVFGASALGATTVPKSQTQVQLSFAPVVKATAPAVVNVYSKTLTAQDTQQGLFNDPFFRQFFGDRGNFRRPRKQVENSLGSGVIVDASGLIVTNNHVIRGGTDIRVVLADKASSRRSCCWPTSVRPCHFEDGFGMRNWPPCRLAT
jgi:serine protease Do